MNKSIYIKKLVLDTNTDNFKNLNILTKTPNLKIIKKILDQLLCAQLEAFYKYGFLHNDIHKGNILFEVTDFKYIFHLSKSKYYKRI